MGHSVRFDWRYYATRYLDVVAGGVRTERAAREHYSQHGAAQGRVTCAVGVNVWGYPNAHFGMATAAKSLLRALQAVKVPCVLCDVADVCGRKQSYHHHQEATDQPSNNDAYSRVAPYPLNVFVINADQLQRVIARVNPKWIRGRVNVAVWAWELEQWPPSLPMDTCAQSIDELWCVSSFVQRSVSPHTALPVLTMPVACVAADESQSRRASSSPHDSFFVLFSFDFSSHVARKNPRAVIEAFRRAFPLTDGGVSDSNVTASLLIHSINGRVAFAQRLRDLQAFVDDELRDPRIIINDDTWSDDEFHAHMSACDVYVSLHRSEGFGLTLLEAMAHGKPVVHTSYGGNTDFANASNSAPVSFRLVPVSRPGNNVGANNIYAFDGAQWADASVDHAAQWLRTLRDQPRVRERLGEQACETVAREWSPTVVGRRIEQRLRFLCNRWPRGTRQSLFHRASSPPKSPPGDESSSFRCAVLLHLWNVSQAHEHRQRIQNVATGARAEGASGVTVVITIPCDESVDRWRDFFGPAAVVLPVANRGMDIGGFLVGCGYLLDDEAKSGKRFDAVLKLHTKSDRKERHSMTAALCGSVDSVRQCLRALMRASKDGATLVGQIGARDHVVYNTAWVGRHCDAHLDDLCRLLLGGGEHELERWKRAPFCAGTFFWMRWEILRRLFVERIRPCTLRRLLNDCHSCDYNWVRNPSAVGTRVANSVQSAEHAVRQFESGSLDDCPATSILSTPTSSSPSQPGGSATIGLFRDGMIEHAMERFFGALVSFYGYKTTIATT